jgi:heme A synthase
MVEPVDTWSSAVFVVAGLWVIVRRRRPDGGSAAAGRARLTLGVLTVLIGVGSMVQHGPAPAWNPVVHDPPLLGAYALVAADAGADLTGRRMRTWWWLTPTLADAVLAAVDPWASIVAQGTASAVAVILIVLRALARPELRARLLGAVVVLGVGALIGFVDPWGHTVWHLLAATAIVVVAPTVGHRSQGVHT